MWRLSSSMLRFDAAEELLRRSGSEGGEPVEVSPSCRQLSSVDEAMLRSYIRRCVTLAS